MLWMGIVVHPYSYSHITCAGGGNLRENGVLWPSLNNSVVSWLRLQTTIDCIPHPYWMYTKRFSTLRCCWMGIWVHPYAVLHVQLEVNLIWPLKPALIVVNDAWPWIGVRLLAGDPPHSRPLHLPHLHPDLLLLFFGTCQNQHGDNRGLRFCYATSCACLWSFKSIEPFHLVYMLPYILWFVYSNFSAVAMLKEKSPPPKCRQPR